ncbi:DUF4276 family protein [Nostoc sp.]|uniref:DUF4276 family protein n=1 Tax=Nostoc sp. TaxID=1180 RepID=UPI002FF90A7B
MDRFENISVRGFRRLCQVELEMRDLIVMIGANGAGKTSFLDILSTLAASANGKLQETLQFKGGLNEILTRGKAQELEISVSMKVPEEKSLKYSLTLSPKGLSYEIRNETLTQQRNPSKPEPFKYIESHSLDIKYFQEGSGLLRPNWEHNYPETSLSQVPKMYREPENLRKSLASCTYYGALDVSEKSPIRLPQQMRPAKLPGASGEDLVSCLYDLRETDRDKEEKLRRVVEYLLTGNSAYDAVIALTDVYTGTNDFQDAADAKAQMMEWVGNNPRFYPHTALHHFEAWLLPYWKTIQSLAKHNRSAPSGSPETVNHQKPPSYWIKEIFKSGGRQDYDKPIHGTKILKDNDLMIAIQSCPELKAFVNQIVSLCDENEIIP